MNYPALLSFVCGFVSLSLEILWVRLYGFAKLSTPVAFGFVLMAYLIGIALGAHWGSKACRRTSNGVTLWSYSMVALLMSAILSILLPGFFGWMIEIDAQNPVVDFLIIAGASCVLAFIFPIAHHLGAGNRSERQGRWFALVYTSNVLGAALGPLITGYILLDFLSLQQSYVVFSIVQMVAVIFFVLSLTLTQYRIFLLGGCIVLTTLLLLLMYGSDPHELVQKLGHGGERAKTVIENRHGVITVFAGVEGDDAVFGGNVYDGRTNLSPERNTNGLNRPLLLAALQPQPKRVLMVGLSIGTWLALVNEFPGVEKIDVVEINSGYLLAAQSYPAQARALKDPRVNMVVDDARRWLRLNKDRQYDMVIMNTTWHWRSNISLLLSNEFFQLMKLHMSPGAILAFNSTGSGDAFLTASNVFEHAYRYENFVYASNFDFRERKNSEKAYDIYQNLNFDGEPFFSPKSKSIDDFLSRPFITIKQAQDASDRSFEIISDRNMITEFKYGRALY